MKKRKKVISIVLTVCMLATSFTVFPLTSNAKSKYYNYSPDKTGKTTTNLNLRSGASTQSKKLKVIPKGKTIPVYGYMEVPGTNWYKVKYDGKIGYVSCDYVKAYSAKSKMSISDAKYPSSLPENMSYSIYGTVKSTYKIKEIKVGIMNASTDEFYSSYTGSAKPNSTSYDIHKLDSKVSFGKLEAGTYYFAVWAKDTNGKSFYVLKKKFTVYSSKYYNYIPDKDGETTTNVKMRKGASILYETITAVPKGKTIPVYGYVEVPGTNWYKVKYNGKIGYIRCSYVETQDAKSKMSISNAKYPTSITEGDSYNISGTVKSTYKIKEIKVGIMDASTGEFNSSYTKSAKPNSTSYDISKLDREISFGKLKAGTYYFAVWAEDKNGKSFYVLKEKFTVKKKSDADSSNYHDYNPDKNGKTTGNVNMREGASTSDAIITTVSKGKAVTVYGYMDVPGTNWYKVNYGGKKGYIRSDYVSIVDTSNTDDISQFPSSYQTLLKKLKKKYPNWVFIPENTNISWNTLVANEMRGTFTQVVSKNSPKSWKSTASGAVDKNGNYVIHDGGWNAASKAIVKYYLDPRNFLNEDEIYQFMIHDFDSSFQNKSTIAAAAKNSFMATSSYYSVLYNSGKASGVNPNVLVSMIIMEQGWKGGTKLISGKGWDSNKADAYDGYYNFFNIGAYASGSWTASQRGLWYAKGEGKGNTSWNRPWNSKTKSITGGALFYKTKYMENNQDTFYSKKFNVNNGADNAGKHEYCTNVQAASSEGKLLKRGFVNNTDLPFVFKIPVYKNMPKSNCAKPN